MKHCRIAVPAVAGLILLGLLTAAPAQDTTGVIVNPAGDRTDALRMAARIDEMLAAEMRKTNERPAPLVNDEDFLRRVTFDLAGTVAAPSDLILFGLNPQNNKRSARIDQLLESEAYATNWARYWRDVILMRATNMRIGMVTQSFETWMTQQLASNARWDEITKSLIAATGDVRENGETALVFAHQGAADEIAAETSRIFLGIQIQCANCHDHPTDEWNRRDFHELAAFFPRISVRPVREDGRTRSFEVVSNNRGRSGRSNPFSRVRGLMLRNDRNRDGKITKSEAANTPFERLFARAVELGDSNKDGALTVAEVSKIEPPTNNQPGRGSLEHYMPDLSNPASRGTLVKPALFTNSNSVKTDLDDQARRNLLAKSLTAPSNPWFARAYVNRIWTEMMGKGFFTPVVDIGPGRSAMHADILDELSNGFTSSGYDVRWLFRVIANTQAYQRQLSTGAHAPESFAATSPTRLRSDQLYNALQQVLGFRETAMRSSGRMMGPYGRDRSLRGMFSQIFAFDPSTPQADITGTIPQALFLMNSPILNQAIKGTGNSRLGRMLRDFPRDQDLISELYLLVLMREPTDREMNICRNYLQGVRDRNEAFEDLLWSLLNSSEFLSKR